MNRVLVTGGAGFIGSHLCARLLALGHEVVCIDDLSSGSEANLLALREHPAFTFIRHDIVEPPAVEVDAIYNLACPASPPRYQADPVKTVVVNVMGTLHCLELARRTGARFLQASTSEVYGDPEVHPQIENYVGHVNCTGPRACYDEGKRTAETLCFDYRRRHDVDLRVARIFNTYGPGMRLDDGRVVSNFIVQALRGAALTVYGEGEQTRSFCYVDDLVEGLLRLMGSEVENPVNLGNPSEFTIRELAHLTLHLTGSSAPMIMCPLPEDDPKQRCPDISRAKNLLGWTPRIALEEGLRRTIGYFRDALGRGTARVA